MANNKPMGKKPTAKSEDARFIFLQSGQRNVIELSDWDPKQVELVQAILLMVQAGASITFRRGSGGRSIGIGGYVDDAPLPYRWCYEAEEMDDWSHEVIRNLSQEIDQAAD